MPLLKIQTNISISEQDKNGLLTNASSCVAQQLGKPESYVMVSLEAEQNMLFAGTNDPLAYLELKSINLPEDKTQDISNSLCGLINTSLGIDNNRIYIEFSNAERHLWGWNGATF
jgi:phenylpyruvate tautomerase PptA (4-oxalocrotonate tautomerase family)